MNPIRFFIAKKVVLFFGDIDEEISVWYRCPTCHEQFYNIPKYCYSCGQKLKKAKILDGGCSCDKCKKD